MFFALGRFLMLTLSEQALHNRAVEAGRRYQKAELDLMAILRQVEARKIHRKLDRKNIYEYVVLELKFDEKRAYMLTSVMEACAAIPLLAKAVETRRLSVCKASRLVSVLTKDNAEELIAMACQSSWRKIEAEVAKIKPRKAKPRVRYLSEDVVEVSFRISKKAYEKLQRVESLEKGEVLEPCLDLYLDRFDPVRKAERAKPKNSVRTEKSGSGRQPLTAEQKHAVFRRDQGRCTHFNAQGERCNSDRYIQIHHIQHVSQGGGNEPENLTTLCSFHHDLVHQLTLPLDNQITWLREPQVRYG
jgi:5-methylcytosine-specific restriction endonuclease McrA